MSKIRIYELARELGVENKIVLSMAATLGLGGKLSHSSSLEDDVADQVRRSIIRNAIGNSPDSEVLKTRVDKASGEAGSFLERRKGNVIRRRRATSDDVDAHGEPGEAAAAADGAAPAEEPAEERALTTDEQIASELAALEPRPAPAEQVETADAPEAEAVAEEAPAAEAAAAAPAAEPEKPAEPPKKGIGPRVLGRIELEQRKPARAEARRPAGGNALAEARPEEAETEEREGGPDWKKKKKTPKKEFTRLELVDYDGRDSRRGLRGGRLRRRSPDDRRATPSEPIVTRASKRVVKMDEAIAVGELARQLSVKSGEVIAKLMELGVMATINQMLDKDTVDVIAEEFGFTAESTMFDEESILEAEPADEAEALKGRPPVVTVMGHVDHGKTSLLDSIRSADVAAGEAGGITQHIGAYSVGLGDGRTVTFLDTPGHAAFTAMRARGAQVTDIVILVVAADEGAMPQTIEALNHAKAANVPIVVAMNKIDKPEANPDKVKKQLAEHGLNPEEWGGDTMYYPVSATKKQGVKELLEGLIVLADVRELRANPERRAKGVIVESRQDRGRGSVATLLVQSGTLRVGDPFVCGGEAGRVRSMHDDRGEKITEAGPSTPVEVTGIDGLPSAGDDFVVVESESKAREVAENRRTRLQRKQLAHAQGPISLEEFAKRANQMEALELNIVLKADVHGSVEAIESALEKLSTEKVKVRVLHAAVGGISESDIQLASASKAIIVGFNVRAESRVAQQAEAAGVELRFYRVIYELLDDVKNAMTGLLAPVRREVSLGRAEVRETFTVSKIGTIAGCHVAEGVIKRGAFARLLRDSRVIHEGKMASLKRFKDDVREVQAGYECGISFEGFNDIKAGDVIEAYEFEEVAATLD